MRSNHRLSPRPAVLVAAALLALLVTLPAAAQEWLLGARVAYAEVAGDAYEAVYDESLTMPGVQLELRWPTWFLRLAAEQGSADGELVFLDLNGTIVPTGITSQLDLRLVHLTAGYHSGLSPWGWYAGGGITSLDGDEEAFFFSESVSGTGYHLVAGIRVALTDRWELGGEVLWWSVSDVFEGGAGVALNDPDLQATELAVVLNFHF